MTKMMADSMKEIPSGMEIRLNMVVIMMLNRKVMLLDLVRSFSSSCFFTVFYFGAVIFSEIGEYILPDKSMIIWYIFLFANNKTFKE